MSEPAVSRPNPEAAPPRPPVPRGGRTAIVGAVGAALVAAVLIALGTAPAVLPQPRVLAHDLVPAERVAWTTPANCGIGDATLRALVPGTAQTSPGDSGICEWPTLDHAQLSELDLTVSVVPRHGDNGVPGSATTLGTAPGRGDGSPTADAMGEFGAIAYAEPTARPVTGLGDEALLVETATSDLRSACVRFRTGNVSVGVTYAYNALDEPKDPPSAGRLRTGALRAAAEVARALHVPAAPEVTAPPSARPAPVRAPRSACDVVPSDLRERLFPEDDIQLSAEPGDADEGELAKRVRGIREVTCDLHNGGREMEVDITTGTAPSIVRDLGREYRREDLDARAEQPISAADERYVHPLAGLGDQAFAAYLEESTGPHLIRSPARVVVRAGAALISITYGTKDGADTGPLAREEAVGGAYAVAVRAVGAVRS